MGQHLCRLCETDQATSSGDVTFAFEGDVTFQFPDMLPHYILEHGYWPPEKFVKYVMEKQLSTGNHLSSKNRPESVGYIAYINKYESVATHLKDKKLTYEKIVLFLARLAKLTRQAIHAGMRRQTRGA